MVFWRYSIYLTGCWKTFSRQLVQGKIRDKTTKGRFWTAKSQLVGKVRDVPIRKRRIRLKKCTFWASFLRRSGKADSCQRHCLKVERKLTRYDRDNQFGITHENYYSSHASCGVTDLDWLYSQHNYSFSSFGERNGAEITDTPTLGLYAQKGAYLLCIEIAVA